MADEPLFVVRSVNGRTIRLTPTIWRKIQDDHLEFRETADYLAETQRTIEDPDYLVVGWEGADSRYAGATLHRKDRST